MSRPFCIFFLLVGDFFSLYGGLLYNVYEGPYFLCGGGGPFSPCEGVVFLPLLGPPNI